MEEKELPLITIVIPSYNHENYIEKCLEEVIKINIPKKVIIIDDGSTDKTAIKIHNFILNNKIESIEFIQKKNSGLVSSLNLGLSKTDTDFLYFIASDDIPIPEGIEKAVNILIQENNLNFLIGGGEIFDENGQKDSIYKLKHEVFFNLEIDKRNIEMFINYPQPILLQSTVFRTKALKKIGGWDIDVISDDYAIFMKLFLEFKGHNKDFRFDKNLDIVLYRLHGLNTSKNIERQFITMKQALSIYAYDDIKDRAIGYILGLSLLFSLKRLQFTTIFKLLKLSPWQTYPFAIEKIFTTIIKILISLRKHDE